MMIEEADRLLENPEDLYLPFMTVAFDLKLEFRNAVPATVHPADKSTRPQMLRRTNNPSNYDLMDAFKPHASLGVVMNTLFNLLSKVIVESPNDVISGYKRPDLDVLLFNDVAISRRPLEWGQWPKRLSSRPVALATVGLER